MKPVLPALFLAAALAAPCPCRAAGEGPLVYGQVDFLSKDGAFKDQERSFLQAIERDAPSYDLMTGGVRRDPGTGVRLGLLYPTRMEGLQAGGSVGYIQGPHAKFSRFGYIAGAPPLSGSTQTDLRTHYIRLMAEAQKHVPLGGPFELRLKAGLGAARGHVEMVDEGDGLFSKAKTTASRDWTGAAWELSPCLTLSGRYLSLSLGFLYAGFPRAKATGTLPPVKWNPSGFYLLFEF